MQNNYDRLFMELAELVGNRAVYESLDDNLKIRVDSLLGTDYGESPNQTIQQLSCHDTEFLFANDSSSPYEPSTQNYILKESSSNNAKRKHTLNSSGRITAKKIETSAFDEEKKTSKLTKISNRQLINSKNRSKSTKDLVRYNMQTSKSKSKSRSKEKTVKGLMQCPSKKSINGRSETTLQKSIEKITIAERPGKQNRKYIEDKNEPKTFKKLSKNSNTLIQPKLKTTNSNLHQSRQILKKLATMETEPSQVSLSNHKSQSIRDKRSMKQPEKELTIMDAINKKQQISNLQKRQLENDIRQLQQMVDYERSRLQASNISISKINVQISRKQVNERGNSQEFKISRKKSEHFISESRQIENKIVEVNKNRDTILASIEEEKYLVNMYQTVIEQIKSQLKIQQAQKIDLIKRLVIVKNTEKMCMEKYLSKEALNDQLFRGMNESMKKWL